jgi:hypothetical protein
MTYHVRDYHLRTVVHESRTMWYNWLQWSMQELGMIRALDSMERCVSTDATRVLVHGSPDRSYLVQPSRDSFNHQNRDTSTVAFSGRWTELRNIKTSRFTPLCGLLVTKSCDPLRLTVFHAFVSYPLFTSNENRSYEAFAKYSKSPDDHDSSPATFPADRIMLCSAAFPWQETSLIMF